MKRYTILFFNRRYAAHNVAIVNKWRVLENSNDYVTDGYFKGWYGHDTLEQAYKEMKKNPKALWDLEDGRTGCWYVSDLRSMDDMLYEITYKQLMALIKLEKITGRCL